MTYTLPPLNYAYNALEPHIDSRTMEIHYTKHHQAYIDKLNALLEKYPKYAKKPLDGLMKSLDSLSMPESDRMVLRNHGGGHLNHTLFWSILGPKKEVDTALVAEIEKTYGSMDEFKKAFSALALNRFGSGWAWLARGSNGELKMYSTLNQDSPYLTGDAPIFGLDVWEHAYYLIYQNRRTDYIAAWWKVLKLLP
ncbi:superoxide dismutase [Candidatus Roizmanbacteria bacterium CG10_big_fil_rev_8_21_14_0_10_45_7]|uniref:Superoxide dismutase n=1 Tax=Candidatus Roizmanbacteria bacterium CG10_big_fil_rev_8_21_14_0_10_45_7 TaxID=1974854 RepID=A0A2M8KVJ3_9BACT|nr:MAG: superoxide dismutase [Candidatus Roizmanbacteria bacterium CG10_big_fil_rev_8_21_14_0_10_45_7]